MSFSFSFVQGDFRTHDGLGAQPSSSRIFFREQQGGHNISFDTRDSRDMGRSESGSVRSGLSRDE